MPTSKINKWRSEIIIGIVVAAFSVIGTNFVQKNNEKQQKHQQFEENVNKFFLIHYHIDLNDPNFVQELNQELKTDSIRSYKRKHLDL